MRRRDQDAVQEGILLPQQAPHLPILISVEQAHDARLHGPRGLARPRGRPEFDGWVTPDPADLDRLLETAEVGVIAVHDDADGARAGGAVLAER